MKIFSADHKATFIKRPNRFIIHALLDGREVICHCPNTGRMGELLLPEVDLILEDSKNPNRKTKYSVVAVYKGDLLIPITSARANDVAKQLIIPKLFPMHNIKSEVTYGKSRFDFFINNAREKVFIEVKSCTLFIHDRAVFPDAPTTRGVKHLKELLLATKSGYRGVVILVVFNPGSTVFSPNSFTDPNFCKTLKEIDGKVQVIPYKVGVDSSGNIVEVDNPILTIDYSY